MRTINSGEVYKIKGVIQINLYHSELKVDKSSSFSDLATIHETAASPHTLTAVLIMSKILSTANIKPIASKGRPRDPRIRAKVTVQQTVLLQFL
ncbi:MAG: hypothetical protein Ct9H300mP3_02780 [Gammaproteobacteria bacterium]|nr:MAG: hypothetical protein Ct9H300mP3_02780 [Gammaproteobacteria bacterium]